MQSNSPDIATLLTTRNGKDGSFVKVNLKGAKLQGVNLSGADLTEADLSEADLRYADLTNAILTKTQAVSADFTGAMLTGACIENWNIDSKTSLEEVICEYVYLKTDYEERRPSSGMFKAGEFNKFFQKLTETVELIFQNGVDWQAFVYSFKNTQNQNEDVQLNVQSIENKGDGVLVIRIRVSLDADKTKIHSDFTQSYEFLHKKLEAQYQARLVDKDKHINQLFALLWQSQEKLGEVPKLMAEQVPKVKQHFSGAVYGVAGNVEGNQFVQVSAPNQSLAEAAKEIQQLLDQLSQIYPTTTKPEQMVLAAKAIECIESNPTLMERILSALKAGSISALEQFLNHPAASFVINALEDWQETRGDQA